MDDRSGQPASHSRPRSWLGWGLLTSFGLTVGGACSRSHETGADASPVGKLSSMNKPEFPHVGPIGSASLPKAQFAIGSAIPLSFEILNNSDRPITIWKSGTWPNHRVTVLGADGKEPPLTPAGTERRDAFQPRGSRRKNFQVELKAGAVAVLESPFLLNELYQLAPGSYTCMVLYDDAQAPTPLRIASPAIPFEVLPK